MVNLIFVSSRIKISSVTTNLLCALAEKKFKFCFYLDKKETKNFKFDNCHRGKLFLGPSFENKFNQIIFLLFYIFLLIFWFFKILFSKKIKKSRIFILNNWNEKLIITPLARIFKLKIFWLEEPDVNYTNKLKIILFLFKVNAKKVKLIVFLEKDMIRLKNIGIAGENLELFSPGIFLDQHTHQDSIFSNLAKTERNTILKKYFTIGISTDFSNPNQIENLFQAIKKLLSVIPNVQLIIVGDGEDRKQYVWITKKLEINNLVWFVGEQKYMRKWLDGLDMFIVVSEIIDLNNIEVIIKAMESKLPVIGFRNLGLEDLFDDYFLLEPNNSEILASRIIELYKNRQNIKIIGKNNLIKVEEKFDIKKIVQRFEELSK